MFSASLKHSNGDDGTEVMRLLKLPGKVKSLILLFSAMPLLIAQPAYCETKAPAVNAAAAIVIEESTGRVLYSKNATAKRSIASTTKIMTAVVALENGGPDDEVTVSKRAASVGGSILGLKAGQKYTLKEMLYAMLMVSANDAAIAVAEHIGGTVENFAVMMNKRANSLGAANSRFVSPHGLDTANQYSSAYDLAIITRHALKNPVFSEIVSTSGYQITGHSLYNTNELLGDYPGLDGVKTGYTGKAGRCLVTTAKRDGMRLITVVLGSPTRTARAGASRALLNYAFENYKMRRLLEAGKIYARVPVRRGIREDIGLKIAQSVELPLSDAEAEALQINAYVPDILEAPVYAGTDMGYIEFKIKDEVVGQSMLTSSENIRKKKYIDYLADVLKSWCRMMREGIFGY